jgi:hypothetical protein
MGYVSEWLWFCVDTALAAPQTINNDGALSLEGKAVIGKKPLRSRRLYAKVTQCRARRDLRIPLPTATSPSE